MGFREDLDHVVNDIRNWAVKRQFEQEGYFAELKSGEQNTELDWWQRHIDKYGSRELTPERYRMGPGIVSDYARDDNNEWVAREGTPVWQLKFDEFEGVKSTFDKYGQAELGQVQQLHALIQKVPPQLQGELSWLSDEGDLKRLEDNPNAPEGMLNTVLLQEGIAEMGRWEGAAANAFEEMFGSSGEHWHEVVQGDYYGAQVLVGGVEAQAAVILAGRRDVLEVAKGTLEALKQNGRDLSGTPFDLYLTIIGAVVSVALSAVPGAGPAMVAAGFSIAGGVLAAAEKAGEKKDVTIGGAVPSTILASMTEALNEVDTGIDNGETMICEAITNTYNGIIGGQRFRFEIGYRSKALDDVTVETLGTRTIEGNMDNLERAARTSFPGAAERMQAANTYLADTSTQPSRSFKTDHTGAANSVHGPWSALRDLFQDVTAANGRKVAATGEALLGYARQVTDEDYSAAEELYRDASFDTSGTRHQPL